jgi:hypothetical protein
MAKKRKKKPVTGYRGDGGDGSSVSRPGRGGTTRPAPAPRPASDQRRAGSRQTSPTARPQSLFGSFFGRRDAGGRPASLQPPVAVSFARGVSAVGRSPLLLVTTFLPVLALWLGFSGYGVITTAAPRAMVLLVSLPPLNTLLDLNFLVGGRTVNQAQRVAFSFGLVIIRAGLMAVWISLILEAFQGGSILGRTRSALVRAARSFLPMMGIELAFLIGTGVAFQLVAGFLGPLGLVFVLAAGLYFFSYAPIAVVAEGLNALRAAKLSLKAARVPGQQHLMFVVSYLAFALFIAIITPDSRVSAATPSIAVWVFTLFVSFLHVAVLAAFTYRWLLIRDHAFAAASEPRTGQKARARG